ncbi:MAG: hypothetical protein JW840_06995 [Candidatus Thermoplasmatota archaeon]|nr:hypothetical protein [Candidatus Thermoplasmatota archaeon]
MKKIMTILCFFLIILPISSINGGKTDSSLDMLVFPTSFSWRDINGTDYTTPIKDQSPAPTCEAYALCAVLETKMQYQLKELYDPDLSESHLYFYPGGTIAQGYVSIVDAAEYLIEHGVPDEGCYPEPHRGFDYSFESIPGWENRTVKITEWGWVDHDINVMKQALLDHGPLVICIHLWRDFFYYSGGVLKPHIFRYVAGHVVTIVGYDDSKSAWLVKNSWGTKWGLEGWFWMSYDERMIAEWYGENTGVMYLEGVYGNMKPDVPKLSIETPLYSHTYLFGKEIPTLIKKLPLQRAAARIIGPLTIQITAENTDSVTFSLDDTPQHIDTEAPYSWDLQASRGLHTLLITATNVHNVSSLAIQDIYVF